ITWRSGAAIADGLGRCRLVRAPVPGHVGQNPCHAAEAADTGEHETSTDEGRNSVECGRDERAERNADQYKAAGRDLHLALKLDRLARILDDRQPCPFPGIDTAI